MLRRHIESRIRAALADTPVVLLNGARQTGKSTLAESLSSAFSGSYFDLDDVTTLSAAKRDPTGFINQRTDFIVIDEVQKAPELFPVIKSIVDRQRRENKKDKSTSRFLLTGSANVLLLPKIAESLAGRMEIITLFPFSYSEIHRGKKEEFLDILFAHSPHEFSSSGGAQTSLAEIVSKGGFPEALTRSQEERRETWFANYVTAILQRDIRDIANIDGLVEMPRLLALLANRIGGLLNFTDLSRSCGIPQSTIKRYVALLEAAYLFQPLAPWSTNQDNRLIKSPKCFLIDSGLAAYLIGYRDKQMRMASQFGHLLENWVVSELRKQAGWSKTRASFFHYRSLAGKEVDIVIEDRQGRIVGIEVKASDSVTAKDFNGLDELSAAAQKRFLHGVVLYQGKQAINFGKKLMALPLSSIWAT